MKYLGCWIMILLLAFIALGMFSHDGSAMNSPASICCPQSISQLASCIMPDSLSLPPEQMAWSLIGTSLILPFEIHLSPLSKPPIPAL